MRVSRYSILLRTTHFANNGLVEEDEEKPVLICSNLPAECNADIMGALFSQYVSITIPYEIPT